MGSLRVLLAALLAASLLPADTLVLRNGSTINGKFVSGDSRVVRFAVGSQVNAYDLADVDTLKFSNGQANNYPPPQPPPPANTSQNNVYLPPPPPIPPPAPIAPVAPASSGVEIPAGTEIVVRLIDAADSEKDRVGQTYRATIDVPVVLNGQTVIPRNADAVVSLNYLQQSGKVEGKTILSLGLKSVTVNGRTYTAESAAVARASSSRTKRSAEVIGGATVLGALLGAVAGGGRGAAIGAGSGAAVGTVAQVATSGQHVKVPSETQLTFTLQDPLDM